MIKVDLYDNRRNPSGYEGEVNVTIGLDRIPNQPFSYVIQLEDELRMKSALVTGKVKLPVAQPPQYPQYPQYPQQPGMQIQIQQGLPQPAPQPYPAPGSAAGGQQGGRLIVIITPLMVGESGAMWRVGNGPWKMSGEIIRDLPAGINTIEFQEVGGWIKPENQNVMIEPGKTISLSGMYSGK